MPPMADVYTDPPNAPKRPPCHPADGENMFPVATICRGYAFTAHTGLVLIVNCRSRDVAHLLTTDRTFDFGSSPPPNFMKAMEAPIQRSNDLAHGGLLYGSVRVIWLFSLRIP